MGQGLRGGELRRQGEGGDQFEILTKDRRGGALQGLQAARRIHRRIVRGEPVAPGLVAIVHALADGLQDVLQVLGVGDEGVLDIGEVERRGVEGGDRQHGLTARQQLADPDAGRIDRGVADGRALGGEERALGLHGGAKCDGVGVGGELGGDVALGGAQQVDVVLGRCGRWQRGFVVERRLRPDQRRHPSVRAGPPSA